MTFYNGISSIAPIIMYTKNTQCICMYKIASFQHFSTILKVKACLPVLLRIFMHLSFESEDQLSGSQTAFLWVNYHNSENATKATLGVIMAVNGCTEICMYTTIYDKLLT